MLLIYLFVLLITVKTDSKLTLHHMGQLLYDIHHQTMVRKTHVYFST